MGTVVAAATLVPTRGDAQVRRDTTARRDTVRAPGDTIRAPGDTTGARRDSLRADSTAKLKVEWAQPDSVMSELISREGYTATKYQGERVDLRAKDRTIKLEGKAAVGRPDAVLVGDTVVYNDSLDIVTATSETRPKSFCRTRQARKTTSARAASSTTSRRIAARRTR
jgi:hypothetical protein